MDPLDRLEQLSDLKVSKDALIETVAEKILTQEKIVAVVDSENNIVGSNMGDQTPMYVLSFEELKP